MSWDDLADWCEEAQVDVHDVVNGTCFDIMSGTVKLTPVGNPTLWASNPPVGYVGGQARGSWIPSLGSPASGIGEIDKTGATTIANGAAVTQNAAGNVFYLSNNLPYIYRLEYEGWSSQAPAGMVRVTLEAVDEIIQDQINLIVD